MPHPSQVTPYSDPEASKKSQVTRMFDGIAPYYDFLNHLLSLGIDVYWRKKTIAKLSEFNCQRVLDVATGTTDLALEAHKQWKSPKIIGLDISKEMLRLGEKKLEKKGLSDDIKLIHGDSENLPFQDGEFDVTMSAFGVRNFENLEKGLIEMHRVLRPGGKILILEFSKPYLFPLKQIFGLYFKYVLPVIGKIKSKDPKAYAYLYESVQAFPDYEQFSQVLQRVGFKNPTYSSLTGGICTVYTGTK